MSRAQTLPQSARRVRQGNQQVCRRRPLRLPPRDMHALIHLPEEAACATPLQTLVMDFSLSGAGLLLHDTQRAPLLGARLQLQMDYRGIISRKVPARVTHRRKYPNHAYLGVHFLQNLRGDREFEDMEFQCIEEALSL
ncbi:MAG: PilZ domain-containing protein [Oleiphilaceae bacterium]|nr:PilZ domain-containing protein [Oleiphilaceae bacterium]